MRTPVDEEQRKELSDRIDEAIAEGILRGQAERVRRRIRSRRRIAGAAAACLVLAACLLSIRVSPVFASMVRDIPGLERFVDLIHNTQDRGVRLAADNNFMQPIGISDEHEGMKFTVQGIIADETRMVLFYDVLPARKDDPVKLGDVRITDSAGRNLPAVISYQYPQEVEQEIGNNGLQRGTVDFHLAENTAFPDEVTLNVTFIPSERTVYAEPAMKAGEEIWNAPKEQNDGGIVFQVRFRIDRAKFAGLRQEYPLGQTVNVEGQKVTFAKAVVTPLRVALHLEYDEANPKQIFGPGDIRLVDDEGEAWINNMGSMEKNHPVLYFESPYFKEPKALYVEGTWFRALDKDRMKVTVDTDKGRVLTRPDEKLSLHEVQVGKDRIRLDFSLGGEDSQDNMSYSLFEPEFTDGTGHTYKLSEEGAAVTIERSSSGGQHVYYHLDNRPYQQPLTFTIWDYPSYIRQPYKIQIK